MKIEWNKKFTTIAIYSFLTIIASMLFIVLILNFKAIKTQFLSITQILSPIIYGFAIAYILNPVLDFTENTFMPKFDKKKKLKSGAKRGISIAITYILATLIIFIFFRIVIPEVVASITSLGSKMSSYINNIDSLITQIQNLIPIADIPEDILTNISVAVANVFNSLYKMITDSLPHLLNFTVKFSKGLLNFIIGIIISIYVFISKETFIAQTRKILNAFLNVKTVDNLSVLADQSHKIFSGFISGKILDSFIIGILCFVGLSLLKMPSTMLVSVIVGVTNVIPYFGPFFGAIPSVFIILMDSPTKAFIFIVFILVLQQFDGNILGPKILGDSTGLSAFWVVFSILLFGGLFGVIGMFIGVPTFAVIYTGIGAFIENRLKNKNLPTKTEDYIMKK